MQFETHRLAAFEYKTTLCADGNTRNVWSRRAAQPWQRVGVLSKVGPRAWQFAAFAALLGSRSDYVGERATWIEAAQAVACAVAHEKEESHG